MGKKKEVRMWAIIGNPHIPAWWHVLGITSAWVIGRQNTVMVGGTNLSGGYESYNANAIICTFVTKDAAESRIIASNQYVAESQSAIDKAEQVWLDLKRAQYNEANRIATSRGIPFRPDMMGLRLKGE